MNFDSGLRVHKLFNLIYIFWQEVDIFRIFQVLSYSSLRITNVMKHPLGRFHKYGFTHSPVIFKKLEALDALQLWLYESTFYLYAKYQKFSSYFRYYLNNKITNEKQKICIEGMIL